ncbi:sugar ABC transporter permease [Plantibacter sp. PA-3-X8]|uniref:carbohydrate ABC transporter permease n=1 Tax=Plantibacter sp. PA-3-X8 TaxID=2480625 RepID=UPI000F5DE8E3|nr:sugar ABC transporter permease [Plantibacter sp. PA-3-X8]AZH82574.1 sugar ABC transporter permease [Plantibacter sp. PA-3-X8]
MNTTPLLTPTSASPPPTDRARTRVPRHRTPVPFAPYLFLLPAIVLFLLFLVAPIGYAVVLSLFGQRVPAGSGGYGAREQTFVGIDNYVTSLTDPEFVASVGRLGLYAVIVIPCTLGIALLFALLLDLPSIRGARIWRTGILLPYAIPGVIAAMMWGFLYLPSTSPLNAVLTTVGLPAVEPLASGSVIAALANISIWGSLGFNMVIMFTALRAVPAEVYEAARIDGCSEFDIAVRIKIPLIAPSLVLTSLFALIGTLQAYAEPTALRPLTDTISSTFFPLMKVNTDAFTNDNINGAAATAVIIAAFTLVASAILLRVTRDRSDAS